jgi:hypothetical protein
MFSEEIGQGDGQLVDNNFNSADQEKDRVASDEATHKLKGKYDMYGIQVAWLIIIYGLLK